ncbi:MAG: aldehyde dehydrogenase family protein [Gammaproteobacteria bacterium]
MTHDFLTQLNIKDSNPASNAGDDQWLHGAKELASINPASEERIASVQTCTAQQYETIIQKAQTAFMKWRQVPAPKRGELIRLIGNALRQHKNALGSLVALEMGKSKQEGDGEVQEMIDIADFAVGQSRMLYGNTMHSERPQHRMYEQWHPYGIVGVISAFNFPVAVWSWNAFIAAIAGNVVVWKPSSKTPLCALAVQHICNAVMQAEGYEGIFSTFIPESRAISEQFVADKRVPLMSFTGSTEAGRYVAQVVAQRLGRSILELGGNNAIIVDPSADLKLAVPAIVFGAVGTAGQRCTSTRRLIVHESLHDDLVQRLTHAYKQVTIGDPLDQKNLMGPLIDQAAVDNYLAAIDDLRAAGGEILCGGRALDKKGFFVEPTIALAQPQWDVVRRETFAPILYVMKYKTLEQAIDILNGVDQGLSSALFSNDMRNTELFLSALGSDCGIANINIGTSGAEIGGAFGGEKDTGGGREAGSDAWKAYMRRQTNTINWSTQLPLAQGIKFDI